MSATKDKPQIGARVRYTGPPTRIAPTGQFAVNSREVPTGAEGEVAWSKYTSYDCTYVRFTDSDGLIAAGMVPDEFLEVITNGD